MTAEEKRLTGAEPVSTKWTPWERDLYARHGFDVDRVDPRSADEVEAARTPAEWCAENGHYYTIHDSREYPWIDAGRPVEVACLRRCGSGPWPVGESAAEILAKLAPGNCRICGGSETAHPGKVHCARNGCLYERPEGLSQRQASARLDVCGPCEAQIARDVAAEREALPCGSAEFADGRTTCTCALPPHTPDRDHRSAGAGRDRTWPWTKAEELAWFAEHRPEDPLASRSEDATDTEKGR